MDFAVSKRPSLRSDNLVALENAGWDDEANTYGLSHSRAELIALGMSSTSFPTKQVRLQAYDLEASSIDELSAVLEDQGVVKVQGVFSEAVLSKLEAAASSALHYVETLPVAALEPDGTVKSATLDGSAETLGLTFVTRHSPQRWDLYPASGHLVPELSGLDAVHPKVRALIKKHMGCCEWKKDAYGFLPVLPLAAPGQWHRDTRSMFTWPERRDEAAPEASSVSADHCDELDMSLPNFYFTLICYLNDLEDGACDTEIVLGSHKTSILKACANATLATANARRGEAILFNGKALHRGGPSTSAQGTRQAFYLTCNAKWYADV